MLLLFSFFLLPLKLLESEVGIGKSCLTLWIFPLASAVKKKVATMCLLNYTAELAFKQPCSIRIHLLSGLGDVRNNSQE